MEKRIYRNRRAAVDELFVKLAHLASPDLRTADENYMEDGSGFFGNKFFQER